MASDAKKDKQSGLGSYIFVGCLAIGIGIGIGFDVMPAAPIIGFGFGLIGFGIARYKT